MSIRKLSAARLQILTITFFMVICFAFCYLFRSELPECINWLGILYFFYAIVTWKTKTNDRWFNPYTILQIFFVAFNYGQPIMWAFGIHQNDEIGKGELFYRAIYSPGKEELWNVQWYVCLGMLLFHIGALIVVKTSEVAFQQQNIISDEDISDEDNNKYTLIKQSMKSVCGILLFVLAPVAIYLRFREMQIARTYGYKALYYGANSTQHGYVQILMYLFFPALVGFLIGNDYSKKSRTIAYTVFGLYTAFGILSGDRGSWLYSLIILIWLHTHYVKTKVKTYITFGVAGVVAIYFLSAITTIRNSGLSQLNINMVLSIIAGNESPIVNAFFEMGRSMNVIAFFLHTGRDIYPYSNTYLTALLGVVSSRFLQFLGLKQVLIADWFSQDYLRNTWGAGFSMIAEAYVNGGYFGGLIYMCLLGMMHGKILGYTSKKTVHSDPMRLFVVVAGLNAIIGFVRGAMYLTLKELFYGVFVAALMICFFGKKGAYRDK